MSKNNIDKTEYQNWINSIKVKVQSAQTKIALSINLAVLELYWEIGKEIETKLKNGNWGTKIIEQISIDLILEFPNIKGFSKRNIYAMRQWYSFYSQVSSFVPQLVAQIPWGHNRLIISKTKDINEALFYTNETIQNSWSRDTLEIQISDSLYSRKGKAITNFENTLPKQQSKLALNILKDPYNFDFLGLENDALENLNIQTIIVCLFLAFH